MPDENLTCCVHHLNHIYEGIEGEGEQDLWLAVIGTTEKSLQHFVTIVKAQICLQNSRLGKTILNQKLSNDLVSSRNS